MSSSSNSISKVNPPSPGISDIASLLCTMKTQNDKISTNDEDNQNSQKHNVEVSSRKRDEPGEETEDKNEYSKNLASFNTLDDDCLGNVLDFVGKKCYSIFGRVNKTCHDMFCSKGLPKETYLYGYGPLQLIQQRKRRRGWYNSDDIVKGVLHFNRRDIFEWMLTDESNDRSNRRLKWLCYNAMKESKLDILHEVFQRVNEEQLEYLRYCDNGIDLCGTAAVFGKLECLKLLRQNECGWNRWTWYWGKDAGHEHVLQYLREIDYPSVWQN